MPSTAEIIRDAESLPVEERTIVVDSLLRSLTPPEPEIDRKWAAVARQRLKGAGMTDKTLNVGPWRKYRGRSVGALDHNNISISPKYRANDWLKARDDADWNTMTDIFIDRIESRYLKPARLIAEDNVLGEFSGFSIIALDCLIIETLSQFYNGHDETIGEHRKVFWNFFKQSKHFKIQLGQVGHPEVRQLLTGREYPGIEVRVVVLEPGDTFEYSEADSEYVEEHPGWRELCFVTDQYGNGTLVFIPQ